MNDAKHPNYITCGKCDTCGRKSTGVMMHHLGTPVLFGCKECYSAIYDDQAKADVDSWLKGGRS